MSVRKIGELKRVPIVEGDRNKISKNTIHVDDLGGSKEGSMGYFTLTYSSGSDSDSSTAIIDIATMKEYPITGWIPEALKHIIHKEEDGSIFFTGRSLNMIVVPPTCTVKYGKYSNTLTAQDGYIGYGTNDYLYYVKFKNE